MDDLLYDALGPLEGARIWQHEDCRLFALSGEEWGVIPSAANCRGGWKSVPHRAPDVDCSCGYYAADPDTIFAIQGPVEHLVDGTLVVGPVKGWGRVVPHTFGWRAEYAKPLGFYDLTVPPISRADRSRVIPHSRGATLIVLRRPKRSPLADLAERYGVPLLLPPPHLGQLAWQPDQGCGCPKEPA
jgi:hypothetical protein